MVEAMTSVSPPVPDAKGNMPKVDPKEGVVSVASPVDLLWRVEFMLHTAFGLEDAGKLPDAVKMIDDA